MENKTDDRKFRMECIIVDSVREVEDDNKKAYIEVIDTAGRKWKIKQGQGGKLKDKWSQLDHGKAFWLTIGQYQGYDYVEDFKTCLDQLQAKAAEELAKKQNNKNDDSIEAQVGVKALVDLKCANIEVPEELWQKALKWIDQSISRGIKVD